MDLLIQWRGVSPSFPAARTLTGPMQTTLRREGLSAEAEISLLFCGDMDIRALNAAHRGKDKPTDVLSFAQDDPYLLGDIVISVETAARQAQAADWPLESEIALLAVHGLLHLLGYDDETPAGAAQMRDLAADALKESGITLPDEARHPFFARFEEEDALTLPSPEDGRGFPEGKMG